MKTITIQEPINLKVVKIELDFSALIKEEPKEVKKPVKIKVPVVQPIRRPSVFPPAPPILIGPENKRDVKDLVEDLLEDLYSDHRDWSNNSALESHCSTSAASFASSQSNCGDTTDAVQRNYLQDLDIDELREQCLEWQSRLQQAGQRLARSVRRRDRLRRRQKRICAAFSVLLRHLMKLFCGTLCTVLEGFCGHRCFMT